MSLVGEVRQAALGAPQRIAVIDQAGGHDHAELFDRGMRAAVALRSQGGGSGPPDRPDGAQSRRRGRGDGRRVRSASTSVLVNTGLAGSRVGPGATGDRPAIDGSAIVDVLVDGPKTLPESAFAATRSMRSLSGPPVDRPEPGRSDDHLTRARRGCRRNCLARQGSAPGVDDRPGSRCVGDRILIAAPIFHTWGMPPSNCPFGMTPPSSWRRRPTRCRRGAGGERVQCDVRRARDAPADDRAAAGGSRWHGAPTVPARRRDLRVGLSQWLHDTVHG